MDNSLWPEIENVSTDNNSLVILSEQASIIYEKTNGKIKCLFDKIQYNVPDMGTFSKAVAKLTSATVGSECIEDELRDKQDLGQLLNSDKGRYKFELYNDNFHYRLFTYTYSMFFPNVLDIDDGICEELNITNSISINSDEELKNTLKAIFSSKSVLIALNRMMQ